LDYFKGEDIMQTVTFLSDFGLGSGYVSQMKGVVTSFSSEVNCIDICHQIPPHNIQAGAFILATTVPYMPKGSLHLGVVDPGVGTSRRGIVIVTNRHLFIGPDNGLFLPAARLFGVFKVYEISNESLFQHPVSNTFHGRDIFASVAGHILKGISFDTIGDEIYDYVDLSFPSSLFIDDLIKAEVLFIDDFGNVITNIEGNRFLPFMLNESSLLIKIGEQNIPAQFAKSYDFVSKEEVLVTIGSHGYVEVSVNQDKADNRLGLHIGDTIELVKKRDHFDMGNKG
jgi:S-adenosyl-L-methionine hydrolase (adenosine-forming)